AIPARTAKTARKPGLRVKSGWHLPTQRYEALVSYAMTSVLPLLDNGQVRGACPHDCPDTCATIVTVENGRATRIQGDPGHPVTQGFLCAKVNRYLERTYHPERLQHPLRRVGPKGSGQFERVTWDQALDEIAARLNAIRRSSDGPQSILPYSYAGTMGMIQGSSMDRRFFHL